MLKKLVSTSKDLEEYLEKQKEYKYSSHPRDIKRHDPLLVQVVEFLGNATNGYSAKLKIEEIYFSYRIKEYDGNETIEIGYD